MLTIFHPEEDRVFSGFLTESLMEKLKKTGKGLFLGWSEEEPVGAAMLYQAGRIGILKEIRIREEDQRKGYGTDFLLETMFLMQERGMEELCFQFFDVEGTALVSIAEKLGLRCTDSYNRSFSMTLDDISVLSRQKVNTDGVKSFAKASKKEKRAVEDMMDFLPEAPAENPMRSPFLVPELSFFRMGEEDPEGAVFVEKMEDTLFLSFLWVDEDQGFLYRKLLSAAFLAARKKYRKNTALKIVTVRKGTSDLIENSFGIRGKRLIQVRADLRKLQIYSEDED